MDSHAQKEIQEYGKAMYDLVEPLVPITMKASSNLPGSAGNLKKS
jgi:thymidylate synthase ThyX